MRTNPSKQAIQPAPEVTASGLSQADWVRRFADCLMLLHPNTVAAVVARHVVANSPQDSELPPEEAAMKFIFDQPMDDVAVPH